mmetsp:Transcript_1603/g.4036  ORF Transcript_1603/g.4036 Transcript_1603/m.4036 type:complete len:249 (-) Transcript_1603:1336-2082(-)
MLASLCHRPLLLILAWHTPNVQPTFCVNRCSRTHPYVLRLPRKLNVKLLKHLSEDNDGLHHRKLIADALALPPPKGNIGEIGVHLIGVHARILARLIALPAGEVTERLLLLVPPQRVEGVWLIPQVWIPMQVPHRDENVCPLAQLDRLLLHHPIRPGSRGVLSGVREGKLHGLQRPAKKDGGLRVESEALREGHAGDIQLLDVVKLNVPIPDNPVNLLLNLGHPLLVLSKLKGRPRQQRPRRLVTRHQ